MLGAAGRTLGFRSATPAARYVDLAGGLDAERHLTHPTWPFAPSGNLLYRTSALRAIGGFDERFSAYDACDLYTRLHPGAGAFVFVPNALVLHAHRATWAEFFRQQIG